MSDYNYLVWGGGGEGEILDRKGMAWHGTAKYYCRGEVGRVGGGDLNDFYKFIFVVV